METDSPAPDAGEARPPPRLARRAAWGRIVIIVAFVAITIVVSLRHSGGDPGNLTEALFEPLPATRLPRLTDVTAQWGLDGWANTSRSHLSGGAALGDLDGDGTLDLVLAGGTSESSSTTAAGSSLQRVCRKASGTEPSPDATIEVNWPTGTITTAVIPSMSRSSVTVSCRP